MSDTNKPPVIFWIIGIIALVWNAMGVNMYVQQAYKTDTFKAMYPDEKALEMVMNTPAWVMGVFAIAVFGGALGCIFLLLRKKIATPIFLVSLIGILVQLFYNLFMSGAMEVYGPGAVIMPLMVLALGMFLYYYSKKATQRGWIA